MIKQAQELAQLGFFLPFLFLFKISFPFFFSFLSLFLFSLSCIPFHFFLFLLPFLFSFFFSFFFFSFSFHASWIYVLHFPRKKMFSHSPLCLYFFHLLQLNPCSISGCINYLSEGKRGQQLWPPTPSPGSGICMKRSHVVPQWLGPGHP